MSENNTVKFRFGCGEVVRDKVSGLAGVVMVRAEYSTGCHHYGILKQELKSDGTMHDWEWIDQSRLERVEEDEPVKFEVDHEKTSGPMPSGPSM